MEKLRVLIADDSVLSRKAVAEAVESTGTGQVEHTAPNGSIAVEWLQQSAIDVVLLDAFMVGQNSLEILKEIKEGYPDIEVIMLSDGEARCAEVTIEALAHGAFDFILKTIDPDPVKTVEKIKNQLGVLFTQIKVKNYSIHGNGVSHLSDKKVAGAVNNGAQPASQGSNKGRILQGKPDLILIASSTGGPAALEMLLKQLPGTFPIPILIVQHMPPEFTNVFAQTLDKKCQMQVREAKNGDLVQTGQIVIAAGGMHMTVGRQESGGMEIRLNNSPFVNGVRPSADVLFNSVAKAYEGKNLLAVILTGMGNDGVQGVGEMKKNCYCHCITQSEETCVVYGMPRCVVEAGLSDETADMADIAGRICQIVSVEGS